MRAHAPAEIQHSDQQLLHLAGREHVAGAGWEQVLAGFLGCLELGATDLELLEAELRDPSADGRVWEPQNPVQQITSAARAASEHNMSPRVALRGPRDELRELAETFDEMLGRLQGAFEGQRRFIADASHELRTPLAVIRTTVDVVAGNPHSTPDDLRAMGADVRAAADHSEHLIGALLILARNERGLSVHERIDLATVAEDVLDIACLGDRRAQATLEPAVISGDPVLAEHLVANLVDNATRYNVPAGEIWVSTRTVWGRSQLTVANTGPVISPADLDRIFQPFQRLSERTSPKRLRARPGHCRVHRCRARRHCQRPPTA